MAISVGPPRMGISNASPSVVHNEMKILRDHLLAVGLQEISTLDSYDASELSNDSGVPTTEFTYSKFMYFAFPDAMQVESPIYICIRVGCGAYFNRHPSFNKKYVMDIFVSRIANEAGVPIVINAVKSFQQEESRNSTVNYSLLENLSIGDFIRYHDGMLLIRFCALSAQLYVNTQQYGPKKDGVFAIIKRVGKNVACYLDMLGYTSSVQPVSQPQYIFRSTISNSITINTGLENRAGGLLHDNGISIVSPIYSYDENNNVQVLNDVFTIPATSIQADIELINLDFTGVDKRYICFPHYTNTPINSSLNWLIEWS